MPTDSLYWNATAMATDLPAAGAAAGPAPQLTPQLPGTPDLPSTSADSAPRRRGWLTGLSVGLTLAAIFWLVYVVLGLVDLYAFFVFLSRAGLALFFSLLFVVWWLRYPEFSRTTRWGLFGLMVAIGVGAMLSLDKTVIGPVVFLWALQAIFTGTVIWLWLAGALSKELQIAGLVAVVCLSWLPGPLLRMEGLNGSSFSDLRWRWSPTSEDQFLKQLPTKLAQTSATPATTDAPPAAALVAQPRDWTAFRGPAGNARVIGVTVATDWSQTPPQQVWKHAIGPAWSSMVLVGDRLFTQEQRGEVEATTCYSASTGEPVWVREQTDRFEEVLSGVGPRGTPTFHEGRLYALGARGKLDCLDALTGVPIWSRDALADCAATVPMWGYSISPAVAAGKVFVFLGGKTEQAFAAYDAVTGEPAWKVPAGNESYSSPIVVTLAGQEQVIYLSDTKLAGYHPETGAILWEHTAPDPSMGSRPTCQPQFVSDTDLLLSFNPDNVQRLSITKTEDKWSIKEVWKTRGIKPDFSDFVVQGDHIYGFDADIFCCVELSTGKRAWKGGRYGGGQVVLLADQPVLLVISEQGELVLVECNPAKLVELARFPAIEGKTWNHVAVRGNQVFARNAAEMGCWTLPTAATPNATAARE